MEWLTDGTSSPSRLGFPGSSEGDLVEQGNPHLLLHKHPAGPTFVCSKPAYRFYILEAVCHSSREGNAVLQLALQQACAVETRLDCASLCGESGLPRHTMPSLEGLTMVQWLAKDMYLRQ
jgi:hypothetical protein